MLTNDELEHLEIRYSLAYTIPIKADVLSLLEHIRAIESQSSQDKVVASKAWNVRVRIAIAQITSIHAKQDDIDVVEATLDEVVTMPPPGKIATAIANQIILERAECYENKEYALEIASALIKAASESGKGRG